LNVKNQKFIIDDSLNKVLNESFDRVTFISTDKLQYLITEKNKINNLLNKDFQQISLMVLLFTRWTKTSWWLKTKTVINVWNGILGRQNL
jgi:hypothetical protein